MCTVWKFLPTQNNTRSIEMHHPAVITELNWWQSSCSSNHLCHLAWPPQSCFLIRLRDFSGIFMCKLNIIVPGKWIGQLGQGFAYLAAQMLTLIKSGNNVNFCNKSRMDPEGNYLFNAWSYFAFFWHTCSISCYCKCSIITTNHTVILLFSWTHLLMTAFSDYDYSCSPSWVALIISCFA